MKDNLTNSPILIWKSRALSSNGTRDLHFIQGIFKKVFVTQVEKKLECGFLVQQICKWYIAETTSQQLEFYGKIDNSDSCIKN